MKVIKSPQNPETPVLDSIAADVLQNTADASVVNIPMIPMEILIFGIEPNRAVIKEALDKIKAQIEDAKQSHFVRGLFYIDNGELSNEEKRKWLHDNSKCMYYIFLNENDSDYHVPANLVRDSVRLIKKMIKLRAEAKELGLVRKTKSEPVTQENWKETE